MSDIVERLRNRSFRLATRDFNGDGALLAKEAADEIERLTSSRDGYVKQRNALQEECDRLRAALVDERKRALEQAENEIMRHAKSEMPITIWKFNPWAKGRLDRITRLGPKWRAKALIRAAHVVRSLMEKPE